MHGHHSGDDKLPVEVFVDTARGWSRTLEDREASRSGRRLADARRDVARRTGVNPGTLENLRNGRLKAIAVHVYERLRAGVIREIEAEMRHLEHELTILRQTGVDPRSDEATAVLASIETVRAALGLPPHKGD